MRNAFYQRKSSEICLVGTVAAMELLTVHTSYPFIKNSMNLSLLLSQRQFTLIWFFTQINFEALVEFPQVPVDVVHWVLTVDLCLLEILDGEVELDRWLEITEQSV